MRTPRSRFGRRITQPSGALELMNDLGAALASPADQPLIMLGGGNPARLPAVEAAFRRRLEQIAASDAEFGRFAGSYSAPAGDADFRAAVADLLQAEFGWPVTAAHVGLTNGSQTAFFFLFNLLAGERDEGPASRILLPLAPEYIGYAELGLSEQMLIARRAAIEDCGDGFFKYRVDFAALEDVTNIAAICVSRPTNPSGNVLTLMELQQLDAMARRHDVPLIIDAAYGLPFPGLQHAQRECLWNDNIILCLSLSKIGLPGARTGIVVAHPETIEALTAFNATTALAPAGTGPALTLPMLRDGELLRLCREVIEPHYAAAAEQAIDWLRADCGDAPLRIHRPEGAFFLWLWLPDLPIPSGELYRRLKARGVLVLSGHHFFPGLEAPWQHQHECLRVSYAQPAAQVRAGMAIIAEEIRRAYARSP